MTKQAGVITTAIVAVATQGAGVWTTFAANTAVDAAISGKIDLKNVAKDAAFTYVTAGAGEFGGKDSFKGVSGWAKNKLNVPLVYDPITGARTVDYFSETALQHAAIDATTNAVTQTAIYGGSLSDNLNERLASGLIDEATANVQNYVGDNKGSEGSPLGVIGHGAAGCVSSDLKGGNCGQGAVNAAASELATAWADRAYVEDSDKVKELIRNTVNPALAAVTSGGDLAQYSINRGISGSQLQNNYLTHAEAIDRKKAELALEECHRTVNCTIEQLTSLQSEIDSLNALDEIRDAYVLNACKNGSPQKCGYARAAMAEAYVTYHNAEVDAKGSIEEYRQKYGVYINALGDEAKSIQELDYQSANAATALPWDPAAFGTGLAIGGGLALTGAAGAAAVQEASALCAGVPVCMSGVLGTVFGGEVLAEFSGGTTIITLSGKKFVGTYDASGKLKFTDEIVRVSIDDIPGIGPMPGKGGFSGWFDSLDPDEFSAYWTNPATKEKMQRMLREPGGFHEWAMVSRADKFYGWGFSAKDIWSFRTRTKNLTWINPQSGLPGKHGGHGSGVFHHELGQLIDNSRNVGELQSGLVSLGIAGEFRTYQHLLGGDICIPYTLVIQQFCRAMK